MTQIPSLSSSSSSPSQSPSQSQSQSPTSNTSAVDKHISTQQLLRELSQAELDQGEIALHRGLFSDGVHLTVDVVALAFSHILANHPSAPANNTDDDESSNAADARSNVAANRNRNRIRRLYFHSYHFPSLPDHVIGLAYPNLQSLDIRNNYTLQDIESIIDQLPLLESFNLSDCPNLKSILPLATVPIRTRRRLAIKNLWIKGCYLSQMTLGEWEGVFKSLSISTGPVERLTLSQNQMSFLPGSIVHLAPTLKYLFVEDMPGIELPEVIGSLRKLRYLSLAGNDLRFLPSSIGRIGDCENNQVDINLFRNGNLIAPSLEHQHSIQAIRSYFHLERMKVFRGMVKLYPHLRRARVRANARLFEPGGKGFIACKERFEELMHVPTTQKM